MALESVVAPALTPDSYTRERRCAGADNRCSSRSHPG